MRTKYTEEDIEFLKKYYPIGDWDAIFARFPNLDKDKIYNVCHKRGISANYYERDKFSKAESYRASIEHRKRWTDNEINVLKDNYSIMPMDELVKLLPDRTYNSIILKANKLALQSFQRQQQLYSEADLDFIKSNWLLMSDKEMATKLNRTQRAIKAVRNNMELFRQDKEKIHYENLIQFFRGQIHIWKRESVAQCNFQCVLTESKNFDIHHLISFNIIAKRFLLDNNTLLKENFEDYTRHELDKLTELFVEYHNNYPLGVCVDHKLHQIFHQMYGYVNTEEQWNMFVDKFNKGEILY